MLQRAILPLWLVQGAASYLFAHHTRGLAYMDGWEPGPNDIAYVGDLMSSGGNDNICIEIGIGFAAVGALWGAVRIRSRFAVWDYVVHFALLGVQMFYLAAIEQGSIVTTIVKDGNVVLMIWMAVYVALWASLLVPLIGRASRHPVPSR
jgi:hypothetical protein